MLYAWLLDSSSLKLLENFQSEIGCWIFYSPRSFSLAEQAYIGHPYPLIYSENLCFSPSKDVLSSTSLAIEVIYKTFIVQQCLLLESFLNTDYTSKCVTKSLKPINILKRDFNLLLSTYLQHFSVKLAAAVAEASPWRYLWDKALDRGERFSCYIIIFREFCRTLVLGF